MKREINVWDYSGKINEETGKGILLTTKADGKVNTMTIGWGTIGIQWGKPIFIAFVRESRHTKAMLEKNPEFTINVPLGAIDKNILGICGTKSGRDMDKIKALGLTLEEPLTISVPSITAFTENTSSTKTISALLPCSIDPSSSPKPMAFAGFVAAIRNASEIPALVWVITFLHACSIVSLLPAMPPLASKLRSVTPAYFSGTGLL